MEETVKNPAEETNTETSLLFETYNIIRRYKNIVDRKEYILIKCITENHFRIIRLLYDKF